MDKNTVRKIASLALCTSCVGLLAGCGCGETTYTAPPKAEIGYVDTQVVMMALPNMADAQRAMHDEYAKIQNDLADVKALPTDQRQAKVDEYRKQLADKEQEVMNPVKATADKAIKAVMDKHGMVAVVDKKTIVAGGVDITKEVLLQEGLSEQEAQTVMDKAAKK